MPSWSIDALISLTKDAQPTQSGLAALLFNHRANAIAALESYNVREELQQLGLSSEYDVAATAKDIRAIATLLASAATIDPTPLHAHIGAASFTTIRLPCTHTQVLCFGLVRLFDDNSHTLHTLHVAPTTDYPPPRLNEVCTGRDILIEHGMARRKSALA